MIRRDTGEGCPTIKPRACVVCEKSFIPFLSTQRVCGPRCAVKVPKIAKKAERDSDAARREALMSLSDWRKKAQAEFNRYIRLRDHGLPCISCGRMHEGSWDAGHYMTTGARPELRFDERNVHRQCVPCNQHLHGNLVMYRLGLIKRIGTEAVEALEGPHEALKLTAADLKAMRDGYRARANALAKAINAAHPQAELIEAAA